MTEVKEAPKVKTTNGQGQVKAPAAQTPAEMRNTEAAPFEMVRRFAEEMDRVFEDFGQENRLASAKVPRSRPQAVPPRSRSDGDGMVAPR